MSVAVDRADGSECFNSNFSYPEEIRWVLGSDSLEDVEEEKNNNDTQTPEPLDRVASCVRWETEQNWRNIFFWNRFKDVEDGSETQYLSSSDPNKYSSSKLW